MALKFKNVCAIATLFLFAVGCASPMQKKLAQRPNSQRAAQYFATNGPSEEAGIDWQPFPSPGNPLHRQIWNALLKNYGVGEGHGRLCDYYGFYLVILSRGQIEPRSFFYYPKKQMVFRADFSNAFALYRGNRQATASNVVALVQHLLAVEPFPTFVISNATDIPHTSFSKENPRQYFKKWLLSKGIVITPPTVAKITTAPDLGPQEDSEYNVFVYMPCGGELFRYEVHCRDGWISNVFRYQIADTIGDWWGFY